MYRYLDIDLFDDNLLSSKLKSKKISIITDLDFISEYIYNYSYSIIKNKFNLYDSKYQDSIYLNPYARTILILKVAKEYLNKINISHVIHLKNNNFILSKIKDKINILNNCIESIKFLYLFNGEVKFNLINYKKVDINDLDYNYTYIKTFAERYLDKNTLENLNDRNKIPNNMYSILDENSEDFERIQHPHFNVFIESIYNFFYYLQIYQMYIQQFEIDNIKKYICFIFKF